MNIFGNNNYYYNAFDHDSSRIKDNYPKLHFDVSYRSGDAAIVPLQ